MRDEEVELRKILVTLVRAAAEYELRSRELNVVVNWFRKLSPDERGHLTEDDIVKRLSMGRAVSEKIIQSRIVELEKALESGSPLLPALQTYVLSFQKD